MSMHAVRRFVWLLNFCAIAGISFLSVLLIFPQSEKPIDLGSGEVDSSGATRVGDAAKTDISPIEKFPLGEWFGPKKCAKCVREFTPTRADQISCPSCEIEAGPATLQQHIDVVMIVPCEDESGTLIPNLTMASIRWKQKGNLLDSVFVGDEIEVQGKKWTVVEITEQSVRFRCGETEEVLTPQQGASGGSTSTGGSSSPGRAGSFGGGRGPEKIDYRSGSGGTTSVSNPSGGAIPKNPVPADFSTYEKTANHWVVDRREKDYYLQNENEILEQRAAEGKPYVLGDGSMGGIQITSISNPILAQRGLKPGDVIKSVNGRRIDSTETALAIFRDPAIRNSNRIVMEVERSGRTLTITYDFQ